jgi:hypothetical protein
MAYQRRNSNITDAGSTGQPGHTPSLADLIRYLFAAYKAPVRELELQTYLDALHGISRDAIQRAVFEIRDSDQYDRLPLPGKLRTLALQAQTTPPVMGHAPDAFEARRATPAEINEVFEAARRDRPDSPFIQAVCVMRDRLKRKQREAGGAS